MADRFTLGPGDLIGETYRVVRRIGEGGMGEVYEVAHARLAGRYAIKLLLREIASDPNLMARFQREAQVTSSLRHPNIVQVLDFQRLPDGTSYIVMEFLEGVDLAQELRRGGSMPLPRVGALIDQVASGLAAAHEQGIVHRDLKPANLFLVVLQGSRRELIKIVDFGISKVRTSAVNLTRTDTVMGTPQYMSPEQAQGQTDRIDARSDQFSLATIAHEMITGTCAFSGDSIPTVMYQLVHGQPAPLLKDGLPVSAEVEAVLHRALAKQPEDRYPTVLDFADAFSAALAGRSLPGPSSSSIGVPVAGGTQVMGPQTAPRPLRPVSGAAGRRPSLPRGGETTLRSATGQAMGRPGAQPARGRRSGTWLAVGAIGVVAAAGAIFFSQRRTSAPPTPAVEEVSAPSREESPPAPPTPSAAPAAPLRVEPETPPPATAGTAGTAVADDVTVEVQDAPPQLLVSVDGGRPRPLPARLRRGSGSHVLVFKAPGYRPKSMRLDAVKDVGLLLSLRRAGGSGNREPAPERIAKRTAGPSAVPAEATSPASPPEPTKKKSNAITDL